MRELLYAFFKTVSGTIVSLLLTSGTVKILAIILGPAGIGLLSLLRQVLSTALVVATTNGQTALVQGGASRNGKDRIVYLSTVLVLFIVSGIGVAILLALFAPVLAQSVLGRTDVAAVWIIRLLAVPVLFTTLNGYTNGVLNIHRSLTTIAITQILGALLGFVAAYPTAQLTQMGYEAALLIPTTLSGISAFVFSWIALRRMGVTQPLFRELGFHLNFSIARSFYVFAGVTALTTLLQNAVLLTVRTFIIREQGLIIGGLFEAAWSLSMTYITLITVAFGTYYLPTLARATSLIERTTLMQNTFHFVTILSIPLVVSMILFKSLLITLLFSEEFLPALTILRWMLIGDYFKLASWVLAYPMLAFADIKAFFWSETIFNLAFLVCNMIAILVFHSTELIGINLLLLYLSYFIFTAWYVRTRYGLVLSCRQWLNWLLGVVMVVGVSAVTWKDVDVNWYIVISAIFFICIYMLAVLRFSKFFEATKTL